MLQLQGIGVVQGIAFGTIQLFRQVEPNVKRHTVEDPTAELKRLDSAIQIVKQQLQQLYNKALDEVGETNAMIFEIHQMMLEEPDYSHSIRNMIQTQKVNAEYAIAISSKNFASLFQSMDDDYMRARAVDIQDVSNRLIAVLGGEELRPPQGERGVVLVAEDLMPSQTVQLEKDTIHAFVTRAGTANSHTAILARMMNLPAVVAVESELPDWFHGKEIIVDGFTGTVYVDPDEATAKRMRQKLEEEQHKTLLLQALKGKENITLDGQGVDIYANIGSISDIAFTLQNDAGGVGLFRSEFLYLERDNYPDEATQFNAYKMAAETMAGKRVVIRTMDIGADKRISYFDLPEEENPAMGYRAIRICLDRIELFKTQLRALLRASYYGKISIMFPMVTSLEEIREIKRIVADVKRELDENGILYGADTEIGVMIETPAAVMISDLLAQEVDFFSIGTNDLTQYTLALDRQNPRLERYYQPHHTGLLRMLKLVADNAHSAGIWVGICGELAADLRLTEYFLAIGIDELSVAPPYILPLREKVRQIDLRDNRNQIIEEALKMK